MIGAMMFTASAVSTILCIGSWLRGRTERKDTLAAAMVGVGGMILSVGFGGVGDVGQFVDDAATLVGIVTMLIASIVVVRRHKTRYHGMR